MACKSCENKKKKKGTEVKELESVYTPRPKENVSDSPLDNTSVKPASPAFQSPKVLPPLGR